MTGSAAASTLRVIAYDLREAREAAAAAADAGVDLFLVSPPGAGGFWGGDFFAAMIDAVRAGFPDLVVIGFLDCGEDPGWALAALRAGVDVIRLVGPSAERARDIAEQQGKHVVSELPEALDLRRVEDIGAACAEWLRGQSAQ